MALKIIGAGLGRTGTLSLKLALEQLGFGPCYHMVELMMHAEAAPLWIKAADGQPDWEAIFAGYGSTVDYPAANFWRQIAAFYPDAKVLLSVRDPGQWFESTQATIFSPASLERLSASPMATFFRKTTLTAFGDHIHDREFMIMEFNRHNAEVRGSVPPDRLLVYEASQGWEPLCRFLDVPVPSTPFPRRNSREEMATMMAASREAGPPADPAEMQRRIREYLNKS